MLLTDVVMPGTSGPELTTQLVERRPELKVIYMSGYTEEAIVEHGVLNRRDRVPAQAIHVCDAGREDP